MREVRRLISGRLVNQRCGCQSENEALLVRPPAATALLLVGIRQRSFGTKSDSYRVDPSACMRPNCNAF